MINIVCMQGSCMINIVCMQGSCMINIVCMPAAMSVVQYVYAFRNYLSEFLRQFGMLLLYCVTSHNTSIGLLGLSGFEHRRVVHQKAFQK